MKKVKTCVYAIALNEIKFVDQFMDHCQEADLVLVCDTGSTDGTVERLRERGAVVYEIIQKPWRFDVPRNTALNLIPEDIDICLSIDLDEFLQPGWSDAIDKAWQESEGTIKRISYDYIWNWKENGDPDVRFFADKIHHRQSYRWKHPCHETLYYEGEGDEKRAVLSDVILHHRADVTKSRSQYLHLLELAVKEDPTNDRMSHYYGRELMFRGEWQKSIDELKRHLSLPNAWWNEERCASWRFISRSYRSLEQKQESINAAFMAVMECNNAREPWLELARAAYANNDWHTCYYGSTKCLSILHQARTYMYDGACWGWEPYDLAALSAYNLGLYEEAEKHGKEAVNLNPEDNRLKTNLVFYVDKNINNKESIQHK